MTDFLAEIGVAKLRFCVDDKHYLFLEIIEGFYRYNLTLLLSTNLRMFSLLKTYYK